MVCSHECSKLFILHVFLACLDSFQITNELNPVWYANMKGEGLWDHITCGIKQHQMDTSGAVYYQVYWVNKRCIDTTLRTFCPQVDGLTVQGSPGSSPSTAPIVSTLCLPDTTWHHRTWQDLPGLPLHTGSDPILEVAKPRNEATLLW